MIALIVAADENNAIGFQNKMLWHLPNDLKFFKNKTWGMPIIMGRKTMESLGKPLPGRHNVVISSQKDLILKGVTVVHDLNEAITEAKTANVNEIMIVGGGEIYKQAIEFADTIYLTRVHATVEEADTYFPVIDSALFELESNVDFYKDEKHLFDYSFQTWKSVR